MYSNSSNIKHAYFRAKHFFEQLFHTSPAILHEQSTVNIQTTRFRTFSSLIVMNHETLNRQNHGRSNQTSVQ